ncbi:hypothetical protein EVAR_78190_1 [Eumeta japonica]|uniref:Uncharacterized protein n=1 Tax=Eumeta variegata TaxID=151549 RepID=A0A4C1UZD1_EUMVA|nr:hypothetical protein EVAR_78190_1 [Eumeta japonica]
MINRRAVSTACGISLAAIALVGVCTDGAPFNPFMMGVRLRFQALVKQVAAQVLSHHFLIHHYALAVKTLPPHLLKQDAIRHQAVEIANINQTSSFDV